MTAVPWQGPGPDPMMYPGPSQPFPPYPGPSPAPYPPQPGPGGPFENRRPAGPASIYDVFNSAVPLMNINRDQQIMQSLSNAGMGGTRFGTASQNNVARIGAETALGQDKLLTELMYNQGQSDANRALQASQMAIQQAQAYDQMQRNRMNDLFQIGQWEQGRGDQFSQLPYNDWMQGRLGFLPMLLSAMSGTAMQPIQQQPIVTQSGGGPGVMDYAMQAAMIAAMAGAFGGSDERLKTDIVRLETEAIPGVPWARWKWKNSNQEEFGVIAQDLEKVRPDLVWDIAGIKHVDYRGLLEAR